MLLGCVAFVACKPTDVELLSRVDGGAGDQGMELPLIPGLRALRITPESVRVVDDGQEPGELSQVRAFGSFDDGDRDVSALVVWSLARAELGTVRRGRLASAGIAGVTQVHARAVGREASAQLTVELDARIVLGDAPDAARDLFPDDRSADQSGAALSPRIVYPSDRTLFPRNLAPVLHQWRAPAPLDLFELRFDGELVHVRYYTSARTLAPAAGEFARLAASSAGAPLVLSVRAVERAAPATVYGSQLVELRFSSAAVPGAIYYWSTANEGVMRAHLSAASATKFYTDPARSDAAKCVGCHAISRDGRRLAAGYDGERLRMVSIPEREVLLPRGIEQAPAMMMPTVPDPMMPDPMTMPDPMMMKPPKMEPMDKPPSGPEYGWGTFNPGGTRLLYASKGKLALLDTETGQRVAEVKLPGDVRATHPDWSPDGRYVAISYGASDKGDKNKEVRGSSIARMAVQDDGTLGVPEVLLPSADPEDTLFFPVYSPDSQWIAFARARGKSKDNPSAELYLLRADGTGGPIALDRLNRAVRDETAVAQVGNTMPTWAPSTGASGEPLWLAFSSLRAYGDVAVMPRVEEPMMPGMEEPMMPGMEEPIMPGMEEPMMAGKGERDQLWAAALDPSRIAAGEDPSYAAFWLPFQDLAESNHRAFWARAEDDCPSTVELCDGIDNDCDGTVDDDCCTPTPEVCGDDKDNDCDGMRDEACGCSSVDLCDNGTDDDCDLEVDEDCVL